MSQDQNVCEEEHDKCKTDSSKSCSQAQKISRDCIHDNRFRDPCCECGERPTNQGNLCEDIPVELKKKTCGDAVKFKSVKLLTR